MLLYNSRLQSDPIERLQQTRQMCGGRFLITILPCLETHQQIEKCVEADSHSQLTLLRDISGNLDKYAKQNSG